MTELQKTLKELTASKLRAIFNGDIAAERAIDIEIKRAKRECEK